MPREREIAVWNRALAIGSIPDHIESQFTRIADSAILSTAPLMRSLLIYLWKHRGEDISEYAVAVEALGRRPDFNCKIDASARVQISRLRSKLRRFYEIEGESFPLRLSIPMGGHQLKWIYDPPVSEPFRRTAQRYRHTATPAECCCRSYAPVWRSPSSACAFCFRIVGFRLWFASLRPLCHVFGRRF